MVHIEQLALKATMICKHISMFISNERQLYLYKMHFQNKTSWSSGSTTLRRKTYCHRHPAGTVIEAARLIVLYPWASYFNCFSFEGITPTYVGSVGKLWKIDANVCSPGSLDGHHGIKNSPMTRGQERQGLSAHG